MSKVLSAPLFGVFLTLFAYVGLSKMKEKFKNPLFNPTFLSIVLIVAVLYGFDIDYEDYNQGGRIISFFLGPATVALAVPIYRQMERLRDNVLEVTASILTGSFIGIISGMVLAFLFGGSREIILTVAPKSVTTPIAIEISRFNGGTPPLTVSCVIIAGLVGAVIGPELMKAIKIKNPVAQGLGIGTASHGLGTSRAVQEGEIQGAFSGLAIGLAGIFTSILVPIIVWVFERFLS